MLLAAQIARAVYGVLLIVGGMMGKVKANSTVSLVAGTVTGVASLTGFWRSLSDPVDGLMIGGMLALLMSGVFLNRFFRSRKLMPAGLILILSLIVGVLCMLARQEVLSTVATIMT
jgi:uncharacterized membrane protein (UPF0136 family)